MILWPLCEKCSKNLYKNFFRIYRYKNRSLTNFVITQKIIKQFTSNYRANERSFRSVTKSVTFLRRCVFLIMLLHITQRYARVVLLRKIMRSQKTYATARKIQRSQIWGAWAILNPTIVRLCLTPAQVRIRKQILTSIFPVTQSGHDKVDTRTRKGRLLFAPKIQFQILIFIIFCRAQNN